MEQEPAEPNESATTYQLKLEGGGLKIDREVDEGVALQVVAAVMGGGAPAARPGGPGGRAVPTAPVASGSGGRGVSLREFLNEVEAKRNMDKIVAIGAYLETERGYDGFTSAQIKTEFRSAREVVPGNLPRDIAATVGAGWLAESPDDPNEFYVTESGRKAIEAKFSSEVRKAASSQRSGRRRRSRDPGDDS